MSSADRPTPLDEVFAHVKKFVGRPKRALRDIKAAAIKERIRGLRRSDESDTYEPLPAEFWQTVKLSIIDELSNRVFVKKQSSDQPSLPPADYFFWRSDIRKEWPLDSEAAVSEPVQEDWPRKSAAGAPGREDWEKIILKAVRSMLEKGAPEKLSELCRQIGGDPDDTQLKNHLRPFHAAFKKVAGK